MSARLLFVDASRGASGDMILGALVDLGLPVAGLRRVLESLPVEGWSLRSRKIRRAALAARKIDVRVRGHQHGRGLRELKRIVRAARLEPEVRRVALAVFTRLVEAEAEAHGLPVERVHLHEAGGTDAIIDVVGAAVGLAHLRPDRIVVSPMTTGFGCVRCEHGVYPVPGPATILLVRGFPVQAGEIEAERLTPTGAAILTTVADEWAWLPAMRPQAIGHGAGDRDLGQTPNVLRMVLGVGLLAAGTGATGGDEVVVIECAVDDGTPQAIAFACERLLDAGALDVMTTPVTMKKGRLGHHLTALARPDRAEAIARVVFGETSTFGLRLRSERRIELDRAHRRIATPYGSVRVKVGTLDGEVLQVWPEYEDCALLARRKRAPLVEIQRAALAAYDRDHRPRHRTKRGRSGQRS